MEGLYFNRLTVLSHEKIKKAIAAGFADDNDLYEKYHIISPATFEECVEHTFENIKLHMQLYTMEYYEVRTEDDRKLIGFVITMRKPYDALISFGINKAYRKKELLLNWLEGVKGLFDNSKDFTITLYPQNTRAIQFFEKNGFTNKTVTLWQS